MEENEKVMNRGGEPADGTPLLLGITKVRCRPTRSSRRLEDLLRPEIEEEDALSLADFDDEQ